jgi:hypothetical protein
MFVPVFEKDGNRLLLCPGRFWVELEEEALRIGYGSVLVECILLGMKFIGEVIEVDPNNTKHVRASIDNVPVAIISGPSFDQVGEHGDAPTESS